MFLQDLDKQARKNLKNIDFCNYAMSVNAVLKDQISTYTEGDAATSLHLGKAGNEIINAITHSSNVTLTTPIK